MTASHLVVNGLVRKRLELSVEDLRHVARQIDDVSQLGAKRPGQAVPIADILQMADVLPAATHLGLHSETDNFHASIPLAPVLERGLVIYSVNGEPLAVRDGGPYRFFIPDHAACRVDEIDECANVKFLDRVELTKGKGFDNRPQDDEEHARLHET